MFLRFGFWTCLLCMIPGLLIRIPVGGAGILLLDILLPIYVVYWLFLKVFIQRYIPRATFLLPGIVFLVIASLSWILNASDLELKEQILSFSYIVRFFTLLCFGLIAQELYENQAPSFFKGLWFILATIVAIGYLQFYIIPDISNFSTVGGFDPHIGRFLGTWMDPNFVAGLLGFFLPIMIGQWYSTSDRKTKILLSILILLSLYAAFLTFSRSGYLAVGLGLGIFFLLRDPKIILIAIVIAVLGISINPRAQKRVGELGGTLANVILQETDEIDPTASLRIQSWSRTLELWQKYPMLGIGYNTYRYKAAEEGIVDENYFSAGGSDSSLLTVLVTTGILGFMAFFWWYGTLMLNAWKGFWRATSQKLSTTNFPREIYLGIFAGLCSMLLHSIFVNSLLFPLILIGIMGVMGVTEE